MRERVKNIFVTVIFSLLLIGFSVANIMTPDLEFSKSERRKLKNLPEFSFQSLFSGDLFEDFEKYTLDQFVMRDFFRGVKAWSKYNVFMQKDNNRIYIIDGNVNKMEYPLDERSVIRAAEKFNEIREKYFQGKNAYVAVIPDKNYFFALGGYLSMDYEKMEQLLKKHIQGMDYIDLFYMMDQDMYYKTDIHWDQERIIPVAKGLLEAMGRDHTGDIHYEKKTLYPFHGSYYGQAAVKVEPDSLVYLTNDLLEKAKVYDYEKQTYISVYMPELFEGMDSYDVFLSGAKPLLTIENPENTSGKELILFRDSFGSSIAPLLLSGYSKVTLVDIRYVSSTILDRYLDFSQDQDVLFMYNTLAINNSAMLK